MCSVRNFAVSSSKELKDNHIVKLLDELERFILKGIERKKHPDLPPWPLKFHPQRNWKVHSLKGDSRAKGCFIIKGIESEFPSPSLGHSKSMFHPQRNWKMPSSARRALSSCGVSSSKELKEDVSFCIVPQLYVSSSKELKGVSLRVLRTTRRILFHPQRNWKISSFAIVPRLLLHSFILKGIESIIELPRICVEYILCFILKGIESRGVRGRLIYLSASFILKGIESVTWQGVESLPC